MWMHINRNHLLCFTPLFDTRLSVVRSSLSLLLLLLLFCYHIYVNVTVNKHLSNAPLDWLECQQVDCLIIYRYVDIWSMSSAMQTSSMGTEPCELTRLQHSPIAICHFMNELMHNGNCRKKSIHLLSNRSVHVNWILRNANARRIKLQPAAALTHTHAERAKLLSARFFYMPFDLCFSVFCSVGMLSYQIGVLSFPLMER